MIQIKEINIQEFENLYNQIVELQHKNNCLHFPDKVVDKEKYTEPSVKKIKEYMEEDKAFLFVAMENSKVIGFLWSYPATFFDENRLFINSLIVEENYRRKHVGEMLVKEAENKAKQLECDSIYLFAASFNKNALNFYNKLSFEEERVQLVKKIKIDE